MSNADKSDESATVKGVKPETVQLGDVVEVSTPNLFDDMRRMRENEDAAYIELATQPDYADKLRDAADLFLVDPEDFQLGDLVTWKPLLKNRRFPAVGVPAIVVEVHPGRKWPVDQANSPQYEEPADLVLGILDGDQEFEVFPFDIRRFEKWEPTQ